MVISLLSFIGRKKVQKKICSFVPSNLNIKDMEQNQLLMSMSPDDFFDRLKECFAEAMFAPEPNEGVKVKNHYVYGLQGICDLFGCSTATAARIKKSGAIDPALSQVGNTIVVDADLALDLLKAKKHVSNRRSYK